MASSRAVDAFASLSCPFWRPAFRPIGDWPLPGWKYDFPRDHGNHPEFKTEWWYFTGNLDDRGRSRVRLSTDVLSTGCHATGRGHHSPVAFRDEQCEVRAFCGERHFREARFTSSKGFRAARLARPDSASGSVWPGSRIGRAQLDDDGAFQDPGEAPMISRSN